MEQYRDKKHKKGGFHLLKTNNHIPHEKKSSYSGIYFSNHLDFLLIKNCNFYDTACIRCKYAGMISDKKR